jgi:hypothetical protein
LATHQISCNSALLQHLGQNLCVADKNFVAENKGLSLSREIFNSVGNEKASYCSIKRSARRLLPPPSRLPSLRRLVPSMRSRLVQEPDGSALEEEIGHKGFASGKYKDRWMEFS